MKIENKGKEQYKNFRQIVTTLYNEEIDAIDQSSVELKNKGTIRLEPKIIYDKFSGDMKVEFKIGNKKMYLIKDLADFYTRMMNNQFYKYGEKLEFVHTKEMFDEKSKKILDFLIKYAELIKYANSKDNNNYRYYGKTLNEMNITLGNSGIDELFEILKENTVDFQKDCKVKKIKFTEEKPNIYFDLIKKSEENYSLLPNIDIYKISIIKGKKYKYILGEDKLYKCSKEFENTNLKLLEIYRQNYMTEVDLGSDELIQLFSVIIPKVKNAIRIEETLQKELEHYKPKELIIKVFFDFDSNGYLVADVKFCYSSKEFNPLDESVKFDFIRNIVKETEALNVFRKDGFMLDVQNLRFILPNEEKIYEFLTESIDYYMQKFDVFVTENFKLKQIKQSKFGSIGVKLENDLLKIDLNNFGIDPEEIKEIMEKYRLKKKYYRLKDGSFLSLENSKEVEFLDKLLIGGLIDSKNLQNGEVTLAKSRFLYLNTLLNGLKGVQIDKNIEYRELANNLDKEQMEYKINAPKGFEDVLRYYQKTGYKWLKTLDMYNFGGILADDMGLGKTLQMLAVIVGYVQNCKKEKRKASFVICPSSLTLNWQNETSKFACNLKTLVIRGNLSERIKAIEDIENYDLIITSYDLLKRDIELYKNYEFRFVIADEAQYLKNSNTQNAKAIKNIKAITRFALTGTPIENSLAELWSIFDFIMPGYLFSYRKFRSNFEIPIVRDYDENIMSKLKMMIEPFILRRNKKEVLKELPEKTVTVLNNEMGETQKAIYLSYLAQAKQEVSEQINQQGFERSHMRILAALTRLRQICCHPSLFIDNYNENSSKLEQCIEIIEDTINSGHKILLFSGYTSMFPLIETQLKNRNINYFKLTGSTKVEERIQLVNEFNENNDIKIFLISLKAGGTGLNLTGADVVIHYDPWWNMSTENQATDRAYRIGQKNNVQVYKLITKNSIEEKIYELQQKKAQLIDNMLNTKTSFISKLSKEEIMDLFN